MGGHLVRPDGGTGGRTGVPPLPGIHLPRPRLVHTLDSAAAGRLTVVTGGRGWGKTTAVAAWAARRAACWVDLDTSDVTAHAVAGAILRAARRLLPDLPADLVVTAGPSTPTVPVGVLLDALCWLLDRWHGSEVVLVLDGLHTLPAGGDAVDLVDGLYRNGPAGLRLVLATRGGPPRLLTAEPEREPACRIGPQQLAFTEEEVAALLDAAFGHGGAANARAVWTLTSGWPAAVRLAIEALRGGGVPEGLSGSGGQVLDALAARVVAGEPDAARRLLADAAVLQVVDAELCARLGHRDARATLTDLAHRGLLRLEAGGTVPSWSVIEPVRDLLARRDGDPPRERALHGQAAEHHLDRGEHRRALHHLVAAGDRRGVGRVIVAHGSAMVADGGAAAVLSAAAAVGLDGGPDARLLAVLGHARYVRGDSLGALAHLRAAAGEEGPVEPSLALRLGQLAYITGRPDEAIAVVGRVRIGERPGAEEARLLCHAAIWWRALGHDEQARTTAARAASAARVCADPSAVAHSHRTLALLAAHDGDRPGHDLHHGRALDLAGRTGDTLLALRLRIDRASYLAEEGAPAEAVEEVNAALRLGRQSGFVGYQPFCYTIRARANTRLGRFTDALADLDASARLWQSIGPSFDTAFALIVRGDLHRRRGEPGQAQAALEEALRALPGDARMRPLRVAALAALARARAADDLGAARELAEQAVALASGTGTVHALLARGFTALLAGDQDRARADAASARTAAGTRRDRAGLAEALELAVLAAPQPRAATALLDEAAALWRELDDPVGEARVRVVAARLAGPSGSGPGAGEVLGGYGVRADSGTADSLAVSPLMASPVAVRTLGTFEVLRRGAPVPAGAWRSRKARDLFKILITCRGRPVPRERLMDLLWPGDTPERTANRLSVLLSTLRGVLDPGQAMPDPGPILADRDTVALNTDQVDVDVEAFAAAANRALAADRRAEPGAAVLLSAAAAAHTGPFLPDNPYDGWAEELRGQVRAIHTAVLRALTRHTRDPDQRELLLLQLLDHDPYDETAHRQLIDVLHAAGRHGQAHHRERQYALRMTEIGVTPRPEYGRAGRGVPTGEATRGTG